MIDLRRLTEEQPLRLTDAAEFLGKLTGQKKPNTSTLWRWCLKGCKGVKLDSIRIGGRRYVTVSAIERFIEARSQADVSVDRLDVTITRQASPHVERPQSRRRQEIEAARQRLDELTGRTRPSHPGVTAPGATRSA